MEGAYGIGITNRYAYLEDAGGNDPQTILKKKADQAKKAAKKAARVEKAKNLENSENIVPTNTNSDNWNDNSDNWNDGKINFDSSKGQSKGHPRRQHQQPMKAENSDWGNEAPLVMDGNDKNSEYWKDSQAKVMDIKGWENEPISMSDTRGNGNTNNMDWNNRNDEYDQPERTDNRPHRKQYDRNVGNRRPGYGGEPQRSLGKREHDGYSGSEANMMEIQGWDNEPISMSDTKRNSDRRQPNNYDRNNGTEKSSGGRNRTNNYENRNIDNNIQYADNNRQYNNQPERDHRPPRKQYDRNFGNRRPGNGGDTQRPFGKREHDRHSGSAKTGVKAVDKREGGGAHNWGTHKQDIEDITNGYSDTDLNKIDSSEKVYVPKEEGFIAEKDSMQTYDEYKATKLPREKPVYNTRQAGEGEDTKKYDAMIVLPNKKHNNDAMIVVQNKKHNNSDEEDEYDPYDPSLYPQRHGRLKHFDIPIKFSGSHRFKRQHPRGGYNDHNGNAPDNRRNGGRRNDPESPKSQTAPEIDDSNFPSLA